MIEHHNNITGVDFKIASAKLYVPVVTLPIKGKIKFLENIEQGFKRTIPSNKYRSEIKREPRNNNLPCMICPTFTKINRLFVLPFKNGDNDPTKSYFDKYYIPLVEIKDFNVLIDNKLFFDQLVKLDKKRMKNLLKCQETMIIQQQTY